MYISTSLSIGNMTSKRQLAAIMFTDISGFSAMMQTDEGYAKEILQRHRSVLTESHGEFGGKNLTVHRRWNP